jgi:pimeloyl-ACP methyl ester carboxylesterase
MLITYSSIPDWWTASRSVVDWLSRRQDVDMDRIALNGNSFGGSLAPIAASHDDRLSAVIAIDGLPSFRRAFEEALPPVIIASFNASNATLFNEIVESIRYNTTWPSSLRWIIDQSLFAFQTKSPFDWFTRLGRIVITEEDVKNTSMPVFIGKGQDDLQTANEPEIAYDMYARGRPNGTALTTYHVFETALGAGLHVSVGAEAQLWAVVLQWLSGVWGDFSFAGV